jgi:tetratricopeptide (TPR) repeat protein
MTIDPKWIKGIIRKADVLSALGRYAEAEETYSMALELVPMNELVHEKIAILRREALRAENPTDHESELLDFDRPLSLLEKIQMGLRGTLLLSFASVLVLPLSINHRWKCYRLGLLSSASVFLISLYKKYGTPQPMKEYFEKLKADWITWYINILISFENISSS